MKRVMTALVVALCLFVTPPAFAQTITTCDSSNEAAINLNTYAGYEPDGLIGHWSLDESVAGPFVDSSPTANNGVYIDVLGGSGTASTAVPGIMGMAFNNDNGDRAAVEVPSHASYTSLSAFTISIWAKVDDTSGTDGFFNFSGFMTGGRNNNTTHLTIEAVGWTGNGSWRFNTGVFDRGRWTHIVITYDYNEPLDTKPKLYKNGVLITTTNNVTNPTGSFSSPTSATFTIGRRSGADWFQDSFDEVRLYNRVLSQAEIQGLYKQRLEYCDGTDWVHMIDKPCRPGITACGGNPNERLVFSSGVGVAPGAFGGISGADALCQGWADAAGLHGTYLAWLGDDTTDPATRFEKPTVPYVMVNGVKVADNWTDLTDGSIDNLFRVNPTGGSTSNTLVASNVKIDGTVQNTALTAHCNNFTSGAGGAVMNVGRNDFTNTAWTVFQNRACGILRSIYCFEQQTAPTTCTNRGEIYYDSTNKTYTWCDGAYIRKMGENGSGSGGCGSGGAVPEGSLYMNPIFAPTPETADPKSYYQCHGNVTSAIGRTCESCGGSASEKVAFVTLNLTTNGNLGGLAGADALCQSAAESANLSGTYKAWLSDSTDSPSTRFSATLRSWANPIVRTDGREIATSWSDLTTSGALDSFLAWGETGYHVDKSIRNTWTNTLTTGAQNAGGTSYCNDWTSSSAAEQGIRGRIDSKTSGWTVFGAINCNSSAGLFCFEQ